jgi:fibronectin type 3 domain-containing protein
VTTTSASVRAYSDAGLQPATTYSYRVVATNAGGDSPPSAVVTTTTFSDTASPTTPTRLKATSAKGKVNLSWTGSTDAGGSGLVGYRIWRSMTGAAGSFAIIGFAASTSYSDVNVTGNVTYWYQLTAFDGAGNQSQPSNTVSAKPK